MFQTFPNCTSRFLVDNALADCLQRFRILYSVFRPLLLPFIYPPPFRGRKIGHKIVLDGACPLSTVIRTFYFIFLSIIINTRSISPTKLHIFSIFTKFHSILFVFLFSNGYSIPTDLFYKESGLNFNKQRTSFFCHHHSGGLYLCMCPCRQQGQMLYSFPVSIISICVILNPAKRGGSCTLSINAKQCISFVFLFLIARIP